MPFLYVRETRKSPVWIDLLLNNDQGIAKCKIYNLILKNGTTTGSLMTHLKLKHKITVRAKQEGLNIGTCPSKVPKINSLLKKHDSIQRVISKMVAQGRMAFH